MIFTAAVPDQAGAIHRRSDSEAESVIAAKVFGAVVIERIFADRDLDFIVLSSSIATMLYHNRFAQVGYVTANSYVEAVGQRAHTWSAPVTVVAWDDWIGVGMSKRAAEDFKESHGTEVSLIDPLHSFTPPEGIALFERALASKQPLVYVSTTDLQTRIDEDVFVSSPFLEQALAADRDGEAVSADVGDVVAVVTEIWRDLLGYDGFGEDDDFFELGGDSLQVARMADRLSRFLGVGVPLNLIFDAPSIGGISTELEGLLASGGLAGEDIDQGQITGPAPLTPAQSRFLARGGANPDHFNVSILTSPLTKLDAGLVAATVGLLVEQHDALRLRLTEAAGSWVQHLVPHEWSDHYFEHHDLAALEPELARERLSAACEAAQEGLDLANGPLVRAMLFELGADEQRLLFVAHHLAADRLPLGLFLDDFSAVYGQLATAGSAQLPPKTASVRRWVEALSDYAQTPEASADLGAWLDLPWEAVRPLPRDLTAVGSENTNGSANSVRTNIAGDVGFDPLFSAVARATAALTGSSVALVDVLDHGRRVLGSDVDISRTIGFFLCYGPVVVDVAAPIPEQIRGSARSRMDLRRAAASRRLRTTR